MATGLLNPPPGYEWITRLTGWHMEGEILHVTAATSSGGSVEIALSAESPEIWRVRLAPDAIPFPALPILAPERSAGASATVEVGVAGPAVRLDVQETEAGLTVRGAALTLEIGRDPWCLAFRDETGRVVCRENPFDVDGLNRLFIRPLGFVRDAGGAVTQITESFHLRPDEHLFGLGEKFTLARQDRTADRLLDAGCPGCGERACVQECTAADQHARLWPVPQHRPAHHLRAGHRIVRNIHRRYRRTGPGCLPGLRSHACGNHRTLHGVDRPRARAAQVVVWAMAFGERRPSRRAGDPAHDRAARRA